MASRTDGRELPLDIAANICDYVAAGETPDVQAQRRLEMAAKYKTVSWETIIALTAHITFRMRDARQAVRSVTSEHASMLNDAALGFEAAGNQELDTDALGKALRRAESIEKKSEEGHALLQEGKLTEAIEAYGKAGNVDALQGIAEVYRNKRPDIAAKALLAAGRQVEVLALIGSLQKGNKNMAARIVSLLGERP